MMKIPAHRRDILRLGAASLALGVLPGCTIVHGKNTTSITLNVAKIRAYAQAGINAAATILALTPVTAALGASTIAAITAASQALSEGLSAFEAQAGANVTIVYASDRLSTQIDALLDALEKLSQDLSAAVASISTGLDATTRASVTVALNALSTIVAIFQALLSGTVVVGTKRDSGQKPQTGQMSESLALHVLGVPL